MEEKKKVFPRVECWLIHVKGMMELEHYLLETLIRMVIQAGVITRCCGWWVELDGKRILVVVWEHLHKILINDEGGDGGFAVERPGRPKDDQGDALQWWEELTLRVLNATLFLLRNHGLSLSWINIMPHSPYIKSTRDRKRVRNCSRLEETKKTTTCNMWSWTESWTTKEMRWYWESSNIWMGSVGWILMYWC